MTKIAADFRIALPASLADVIAAIHPCDPADAVEARRQLDSLTKPIGSLGRMEQIAEQLFSIFAREIPLPLKRAVYVFAADHGVTASGVSAYPSAVTAQMVLNFLKGGAAVNVLAREHRAALTVVDVGVDADFEDAQGLCRMKVRRGTSNMHIEPAMTEAELFQALEVGIRIAEISRQHGENLVAVGEMGIGNTTAASAITSVLTRHPVEAVTGCGAGLSSEARTRKIEVIHQSLQRHFGANPEPAPLELLRCVGGLEIAAMTGFILGSAARRTAIVCDGFISTAAAAVAHAVAPHVRDYLFAGHCSEEPGHRFLLRAMGLTPILDLGLRLGEGTGAVLAMPIIESSARLLMEMATFSSAGVSEASH